MKKHDTIKCVWIMAILTLSTSVMAAGKPAPASLTPEGKKLEAYYGKLLVDLQESIKRLASTTRWPRFLTTLKRWTNRGSRQTPFPPTPSCTTASFLCRGTRWIWTWT